LINNNDFESRTDSPGYYLGNYRLIRLLGSGGFASVYLGEHRYLKRLAAVKVLRTALAEREKTHFLEEARLLATLSHPRIVRVLEFAIAPRRSFIQNSVVIEEIPFLVMDYIAGGSLRTLYPMGTRLLLHTIVVYIKQVAEALQYAHEHRIIHRDIKPENLLFNEQEEVMLSDFGLALFAPQPGLSPQETKGTIPYTAPEQLQGKPCFASDQYSLAIVAYEWLCGHPPFTGTDAQIIMQHISFPPPPLSNYNVSIPQQVEDVLLKALAKDPAQRFESVVSFAQTFEQASHQSSHKGTPSLITATASQNRQKLPFFYYLSEKPISAGDAGKAHTLPQIQHQENSSVVSSSTLRNRQRMLQKVRRYWIKGVLEPSLRDSPFITPMLLEKQDAVATPWPATQHQLEQKTQKLIPSVSIIEAYDEAGGELLILGEGGSGKTTLLLQLTNHLLTRAEQNDAFPLPIIFLLSSWTEKQLPLDQWLIEELNDKYQVPRLLAEQWLHSEMILPLLDGLDEVASKVRSSCIEAINAYRQHYGFNSMVVCSRLTEYLLFPPRVLLQRAVVVQSLTLKQVDTYFKNIGGNFAAIYTILSRDMRLYGLITTPLMLTILTVAYQNKSAADLLAAHSWEERYQRILAAYVEQMLYRRRAEGVHTPDQLTERLAFLARKMQQQGHTIFYLEQMQPTWLRTDNWLQVYMWLAVFLPGALIGALTSLLANVLLFQQGSIGSLPMDMVYGIVMGYLFSNRQPDAVSIDAIDTPSVPQQHPIAFSNKKAPLQTALFVGLTTLVGIGSAKGWTAGLVNALLLALLSIPIQEMLQKPGNPRIHARRKKRNNTRPMHILFPLEHVKNSFLIGMACGLTSIVTLLVNHNSLQNGLVLLSVALPESLQNILIGTLLSLLLTKNTALIHCVEVFSWSWKRFSSYLKDRGIFYDLLIALLIGIIFGSRDWLQGNFTLSIAGALLFSGLITIGLRLLFAISQGIRSNTISDHYRTVPNEGIKRSFFHGNVSFGIGIVVFACFGVIINFPLFLLIYGPGVLGHSTTLQSSLLPQLLTPLLLAPVGGFLVALSFGWLPTWKHAILRLLLRLTHVLPLRLSRLLDDATASVLLRRIGGGYIFIHRTLLEYFASLDSTQSSEDAAHSSSHPEPLVRLL
jgi:serine/threonine protein kinase